MMKRRLLIVLACVGLEGLTLLSGLGASGVLPHMPALPFAGHNHSAKVVYVPVTTRYRPPPAAISGFVVDISGPVAEATVRVQATENKTGTAADGSFTLGDLQPSQPITVTAWAEGYFVGWIRALPGPCPVTITLRRYYTTDNPDYTWFACDGIPGSIGCSHCMPSYQEWVLDAHAGSAVSPRFLSMYNGTDVHGNTSPRTRYTRSSDGAHIPLLPDWELPYYGPGYRLDFPDTTGNCACCHVPGAAVGRAGPYVDSNQASGIEREGVFCEFCHKIGEVFLDPQTGLPHPEMPGVLSLRLYRPPAGEQLFFAQFDDVTRRVSRLPLIEESAFCAPCHFGVFWDVPVYNSFEEWLDSSWSDPATGKTCQQCHMPTVDYDYFVYPQQGGHRRDRSRILSHLMPGALDPQLLQNSLSMTVTARADELALSVNVDLTNDKTGHHIPTDSPLRHLILLVQATDGEGHPLPQLAGPTLPEWCGVGDPAWGYYADLPGKAFAKVLVEQGTEVYPTGAYWRPTRILSDNRLAAFATDRSSYIFTAPAEGGSRVEVTLLFRRAFKQLMDWKDWDVPDIVMEHCLVLVEL